jgi:23S rRNA pseudouridine2605 synthase
MADEPIHPLFRGTRPKPKRVTEPPATKARPAARSSGAKRGKLHRKRKPVDSGGPPPGMVRIQKVLAEAGLASRRACEELVLDGRVRVNGKVIISLPCFVTPGVDKITVDGAAAVVRAEKKVYILLNKPRNVVCTNSDPAGRRRVVDLVRQVGQRVFPVGRLDAESTGLILLTNDGELANRVAHPRYGLAKTYVVEVEGNLPAEAIEQLKAGTYLDGKRTAATNLKVLSRDRDRTTFEVRLRESGNREIRRIVARMGFKVRALRRVAIGPITDRGIKTGHFRLLNNKEVQDLLRQTEFSARQSEKK